MVSNSGQISWLFYDSVRLRQTLQNHVLILLLVRHIPKRQLSQIFQLQIDVRSHHQVHSASEHLDLCCPITSV